MTSPDVCLIVPTVRQPTCVRAYYANARQHNFDLSRIQTILITENECDTREMREILKSEGVSGEVFDHSGRLRWFGEHKVERFRDLIPRHSHAETSFGLLYVQAEPQYKFGIFVDDDTEPIGRHDFFGTHLRNLEQRQKISRITSDTRWVNVLHNGFSRHRLYPRGFPYSMTGEKISVNEGEVEEVVLSQGLWTNIPDLDAVRILCQGDLEGQSITHTMEADFGDAFSVAGGNYVTVSSMNLAFKREIIPAFYQLPMDDNPWCIGRFDDIWSGVFLKKIADLKGREIVCGLPLCRHNKARRSTFKDLRAEAPGLELNEHLWRVIDKFELEGDWLEMYRTLARLLTRDAPTLPFLGRDFLSYCARAMSSWTECCEALSV